MQIRNNTIKVKGPSINWGYVIKEFLVFIMLPPVIGVPMAIQKVSKIKIEDITKYLSYFICIGAFIAAVIATKPANGDQISYYMAYKAVPDEGFIGSLINIYGFHYDWEELKTNISPEFMNGVYNYIGYYLTFGYYPLFLFLYFVTEITLISLGVYYYCRKLERPNVPIIAGVICFSFFYLYFILCSHIQKQFMGQAIMMYVLGVYSFREKMNWKLWLITAISICTHQSMLLFIPFLIYKPLNSKLSKKNLLIFLLLTTAFFIVGPTFMGDFSDSSYSSSAFSYGANRFANATGADDGVKINIYHVIAVGVPLGLICLKKLWFDREKINNHNAFMLNICLILLACIAAMFKMPLVQYRYFMMTYCFIPMIIPFVTNDIDRRNTILKYIALFMILSLIVCIPFTGRDYAPVINLIIEPPVLLVAGIF